MNEKRWTPDAMYQVLKKSIIGQDNYLKDLCSCIWLQNQRREHYLKTGEKLTQPKFNMLVIGKSGMGKTATVKEVAKLLNMPLVIEDASEFRGAGWKGRQVTEIVGDIMKAVETDDEDYKSSASFSIVVLDEMDKIFMEKKQNIDSFSPSNNLLKFIEGTKVNYTVGNQQQSMDTENLLFICAGAFDGLEEIIANRIHPKTIGFSGNTKEADDTNLLAHVTTEDLVAYGINEQLLGRLPFVTVMNKLNACDYKKILLESDISPVKHLNNLFVKRYGIELSITDAAADQLAGVACKKNLGARGLQTQLITLLKDTIYQMADNNAANSYKLEYVNNNFTVTTHLGKRIFTGGNNRFMGYALNKMEMEKLQQELNLGIIDKNNIKRYTDVIFETVENHMQRFMQQSITDNMEYRDIISAKHLLAACVTKLFINAENDGVKKTMLQLLNNIKTFDIHKVNTYSHPLSVEFEQFARRLYFLPDAKVEDLKKKTWNIVKIHAVEMYELDLENEEAIGF